MRESRKSAACTRCEDEDKAEETPLASRGYHEACRRGVPGNSDPAQGHLAPTRLQGRPRFAREQRRKHMRIKLHHVNLCSKDVLAMDEFYRTVLDLQPEPSLGEA